MGNEIGGNQPPLFTAGASQKPDKIGSNFISGNYIGEFATLAELNTAYPAASNPYAEAFVIADSSVRKSIAGVWNVVAVATASTAIHFVNKPSASSPGLGSSFLCDDVGINPVLFLSNGSRWTTPGPILAASATFLTGASSTSRQILYSKSFPAALLGLASKFSVDGAYETVNSANAKNLEVAILVGATIYPILKIDMRNTNVRTFYAPFNFVDDGVGNPQCFDYTGGINALSLPGFCYPTSGPSVIAAPLASAFTLQVAITCANATEAAGTSVDNFNMWLTV